MSDRCYVVLTIPTACKDRALSIIGGGYGSIDEGTAFCHYNFEEVNYGELRFLDKLRDAGIPYTSAWERGSEYAPGEETCRYTSNGEMIVKELYEGCDAPTLEPLLERIDDPYKLREYILNHKEKVAVLPWDNQVEYGKLYATKRLISN